MLQFDKEEDVEPEQDEEVEIEIDEEVLSGKDKGFHTERYEAVKFGNEGEVLLALVEGFVEKVQPGKVEEFESELDRELWFAMDEEAKFELAESHQFQKAEEPKGIYQTTTQDQTTCLSHAQNVLDILISKRHWKCFFSKED